MLGINNSMPKANQVKFHGSEDYRLSEYDIQSRDNMMADINATKADFDEFASSLDNNSMTKKGSGFVRGVSTLIGLGGTFVMAKYGSKASINILKSIGKSSAVKKVVDGAKNASTPIQNHLAAFKTMVSEKAVTPVIDKLKPTKFYKGVQAILEKPMVKNGIEQLKVSVELAKTSLKSIKGDKVQSIAENTLAASTTASVLIDDLAGRNDDKSNFDLAMGASGGDQ